MARTKKDNNGTTETKAPARKRTRKGKGATPRQNVEAVAQAVEDADESVGVKVWWDLWKVDGLHTEMAKAFTAFGAEDYLPAELTPVRRMRYAMYRMKSQCGVDFKRAGRADDWVTFAAVKTEQTTNDEAKKSQHKASVDPQVVSSIAVNAKTGKVSVQNPRCKIAKAVVDEYARLETHFTSWELSNAIVAVIEGLGGVRLRLGGGLYYVPHPQDDKARVQWDGAKAKISKQILALSQYVQNIGECDFYIEEVAPHSATARAAQNTTMHGLDKELNEILEQAEAFVDGLGRGETVSTRSLNAKIKAVKALRGRAELMDEILADRGKKLLASAEVLQGALKGMVDGAAEVRKLEKVEGSEAAQEVAQRLAGELATKARADLDKVLAAAAPPAEAANGEEDVAKAS